VSIQIIVEFFLCSLALGLSSFSIIASTQLTGVGFFKLSTSLTIVCLLIALPMHLSGGVVAGDLTVPLYGVALISMGTSYFLHRDKKGPLMWAFYLLQNISLILVLFEQSDHRLVNFAYLLSSTFYLGIIVYAMVLGHWYLVVPKLSEKPLKISMIILSLLLVIKVSISTFGYFESQSFFELGTGLGAGYSFNWIMILMRAVWGYLIIGIMAYFSWRLICIRSIQSATGMLYAMVFFVFIGELISSFLYYKYGMMI